jgi:hypothetical protein
MEFIRIALRMNQSDISSELRREFAMRWAPIDEVQKELAIEAAREEGKLEVAGRMLSDGFSIENVIKYTGLDEEEILSLGWRCARKRNIKNIRQKFPAANFIFVAGQGKPHIKTVIVSPLQIINLSFRKIIACTNPINWLWCLIEQLYAIFPFIY